MTGFSSFNDDTLVMELCRNCYEGKSAPKLYIARKRGVHSPLKQTYAEMVKNPPSGLKSKFDYFLNVSKTPLSEARSAWLKGVAEEDQQPILPNEKFCPVCWKTITKEEIYLHRYPNVLKKLLAKKRKQKLAEELKKDKETTEVSLVELEDLHRENWVGLIDKECEVKGCSGKTALIRTKILSPDQPPLIQYKCQVCKRVSSDYRN